MTTSTAAFPKPILEPTGKGNWLEVFKFTRLCVVWLNLIFVPVWLVCWLVGELLPAVIGNFSAPHPQVGQAICQTLEALVPILSVMVFIPINAMFMVLCERRALALFTVRKGPNRVGPDGLLQTAADAVKLLFKEDITPTGADILMFTLAPILFFAPSIFGVLPLLSAITFNHPLFQTTALPTGIFFVLALSAIPVVALVMGGWASNNKYSLVGGLRSAAQAISYEIPLVLSLVTICYLNGTLSVGQIVALQSVRDQRQPVEAFNMLVIQHAPPDKVWLPPVPVMPGSISSAGVPEAPMSPGLLHWNLFGNGVLDFNWERFGQDPQEGLSWMASHWSNLVAALLEVVCCFLLFGIYMTGACAEINRIPFDLPEAESELVSGYNTEYSGIKFAIFFLAEFTNLFIVSTIASVMFLGGGMSPIPGFLDPWCFQKIFNIVATALGGSSANSQLLWLLGSLLNPVTLSLLFWMIVKVYSIVIFAILVRGTLPRFRIDQLMDFGWKRLIPLALILFLAMAFLKEIVSRV